MERKETVEDKAVRGPAETKAPARCGATCGFRACELEADHGGQHVSQTPFYFAWKLTA